MSSASSASSSGHSSTASSASPSPTATPATTTNDPSRSPSSLLAQLNSLQAKHEAVLRSQSLSASPSSTTAADAVLPQYAALLGPISALAPSSTFLSGPSSPLLVDGLLTSLNRYREIKGSMAIVALHLKALTALATLSRPYARLMGQKAVVQATVGTMKTYAKFRKLLLDCLELLFAIHRAQPEHVTASVHPFTRGRFQGVTLYRRLSDILSNPSFRSYRSLLTPTLDLVLVLLRLSITTTRKAGTSAPPAVEKRLRFAIPALMELAYLLVFGTTTLRKEKAKKVLRPRTPSTRMFKSLILVLSRLSCLPSLVPVLVRLGGCEWAVEVLKEMRDHVPSVTAVVVLLLSVAKDQRDGCPALAAIVRGHEDDVILRYVNPLVDAKHVLLFRHTRDLLWHLALYERHRPSSTTAPTRPYHYGYNLLDPSYFGVTGNDYHVKFAFLDRQKHARMDSLRDLVAQGADDEDGDAAAAGSSESDEDESDGLESDADEDDDGLTNEERRSIEHGESTADPSAAAESYDSEGDAESDGEGSEAEVKSPGKVRAPHGWMEVRLPEQAVQAGAELRREDVDEEEKEDGDDSAARDEEPHNERVQPEDPAAHHRPHHHVHSADPVQPWDIQDFMPERWDRSTDAAQSLLAKHQREVEAAKTNSVRFFLNKHDDLDAAPSSSPDSSPAPSPKSASSSASPSFHPPCAADLLHSSMFSRTPHAPLPAPTAVYPEPLAVATVSQFLHDLNEYYHQPAVVDGFTPRVVYDRNVLGALQSITGEVVAEPLSLFNSHPSLSPSSPPSLSFESRFESGNLCRATQLSPAHYRLELSDDLNTNAHTQWFLFRVRHMRPGVAYRFDIVNLEKKTSAFQKGMKPAMYSEREAARSGVGWCRALMADKVYYLPNHDVMLPRMTKAEVSARTPRLSLIHTVLQTQSAGHSRAASQGGDGEEEAKGYVDVEELVKRALKSIGPGDDVVPTPGLIQTAVKGEAGAMLTSFLSSETPLDRSFTSAPASTSSTSVPISPASGGASPWGSARPSLLRHFSAPPPTTPVPAVQYHSTLSFTLSFVHEHDTVYLAHFYPYTYTFLRNRLSSLQAQCPHLIRQPLCYTRIGNVCELLTITDLSLSAAAAVPVASRPIIVLSSRVHPGETNASWALDGLLTFLTSSAPQAVHLRQLAVFKVVPMLNIDGVVEGNYRSNLSGLDLNRYWARTSAREHPTIHWTKQLLWALGEQAAARVLLYVDWHGHSTMASTGLYGCVESESTIKAREATAEERRAEEREDWLDVIPPQYLHLRERLFPMLVSARGGSVFSYDECTYNVSQYKAGSARVVVWQGLRLATTYTLETSFYGSDAGKLKGIHWNTQHYEKIGKSFGLACYDLVNPDRTACRAAFEQVRARYRPLAKGKMAA